MAARKVRVYLARSVDVIIVGVRDFQSETGDIDEDDRSIVFEETISKPEEAAERPQRSKSPSS